MNKKAKCSEKVRGLLCFIAIFALSANISAKPQQEDVLITLKLDGVALQTAIDHIEEQSPYLFMNSGVDMDQAVGLNVTEQKIAEVCEALFFPINVSYRIEARHIYISNQPAREEVEISGTIIDTDGFPIPGAAVIESGTSNGTTTDMDGNFALTVSGSDANIEITSLGYDAQTLSVGSRTLFRITLQEEAVALEGTVVTALGIRRDEKALSYNVQEVQAERLTEVKNANFINALSGKVAGVTINASSSGVGGAAKVVLRGNKSISQSSNALYVIDGIPMYNFGGGGGTEFDSKGATESIADINPEDIKSISVLTGAAAAALYGSQAANGAIMITTKAGEVGKLKVSFSSNTEFLSPFFLPQFQNSYGTGINGASGGSSIFSWGAYVPESGIKPDKISLSDWAEKLPP